MKKIGLIGLGIISKKYKLGLLNNGFFKLVSVCDKNEDQYNISEYKQYKFYSDYRDMIIKEKLDYVLVATSTESHESVIMDSLELGINVLSEKPLAIFSNSIKKIFDKASEKKLLVDCIFHWIYGSEAIFMYNYLRNKKILSISIYINDNYAVNNNRIRKDRVSLLGTWLDSGINAISFISNFVNIDELGCEEKSYYIDETCNMPYMSKHVFKLKDLKVCINIDWSKEIDKKITYIRTVDESIVVDHSNQRVLVDEKEVFDGNKYDRLSTHYLNYFSNFNEDIKFENIRKMHKFLFEYNYTWE